MKYLAIETSTARASVALSIDGQTEQLEQTNLREHAEHLLPMVDKLLTGAGVGVQDLDGIVFGRGPGSFTGLRIACSIVKGLAYPYDLPIYPVSSLASIAEQVLSDECPAVLAVMDARMQEVYWGYYTQESGFSTIEKVSSAESITLPENRKFVLAGVGFDEYCTQISQSVCHHMVKKQIVYPDAAAMIRIVMRGACNSVSALLATPVYIRDNVVNKA